MPDAGVADDDLKRRSRIKEWEHLRAGELWMDRVAYGGRFIASVGFVLFAWGMAEHWALSTTWKVSIVGVGLASLFAHLITWLRLWGSFVERRLSEVEARIVGEEPGYYGAGVEDRVRYSKSPLFESLRAIDLRLRSLQRCLDIGTWCNGYDHYVGWEDDEKRFLGNEPGFMLAERTAAIERQLEEIQERLGRIEGGIARPTEE